MAMTRVDRPALPWHFQAVGNHVIVGLNVSSSASLKRFHAKVGKLFSFRSCHAHRAWVATLLGLCMPWAQAAESHAVLQCEPVYLPARTVWPRTVDIAYDQRRIQAVRIDGQQVYTFQVRDTWIFTSQDNERIQIDTATLAGTSDFRGLATGQGRCVWAER